MKSIFLGLCMAILAASTGLAASGDDAAPPGTTEWLSLIDQGHYAESWSAAGSVFQARIEQRTWVKKIESARKMFGAVRTRQVAKVKPTTSLPGVPDGEYAIVSFQTDFANKPQANETVSMMRENGQWHAVGYFIK